VRYREVAIRTATAIGGEGVTAYEIIRKKRDGGELTGKEIDYFVRSYTRGEIPDYQAAALLMAIVLIGMSARETADLTMAMMRSGDVIDLSDIPGVKVDKHSTGGVGDKVSLVLAPLVAACGVPVPMVSGRALGHTGGTLDKLEAIPGLRTDLSVREFRDLLRGIGVAMIGQTDEMVPADRELYALRDTTATVESIPLISASIMSKKIAEGADALVLDVKTGSGAFMQEEAMARELARAMIDIGVRMGKRVRALITDMDQPLGRAVGNAVEVAEAIETLRGEGPDDLRALCLALGSEMLRMGERAASEEEALTLLADAISSGRALQRFREMVAAQGGDARVIDDPSLLPSAPLQIEARAEASGYVQGIETREVGQAAAELGAGRATKESSIDHGVGIMIEKKVGDHAERGEPLARILARSEQAGIRCVQRIVDAYGLGDRPGSVPPLVRSTVE
jgi:pyrimidine-nucleoside phosphorylase